MPVRTFLRVLLLTSLFLGQGVRAEGESVLSPGEPEVGMSIDAHNTLTIPSCSLGPSLSARPGTLTFFPEERYGQLARYLQEKGIIGISPREFVVVLRDQPPRGQYRGGPHPGILVIPVIGLQDHDVASSLRLCSVGAAFIPLGDMIAILSGP